VAKAINNNLVEFFKRKLYYYGMSISEMV